MSIMIDQNKFMMGVMYTPFCRTICPPEDQWSQDIKNIGQLGYTCLHGFCEWHDVEYEKGRFDFSRVNRLIELSYENGVKPIINVATHNGIGYYPPRWLMQEYKDCGFVTSEGNCDPAESMYKFPCLDDPWYQGYADRYLIALSQHFKGDDRIAGWVIWGEPALSFGGKPVCYCVHTVQKFRQWLKGKYANINELNIVWGTDGPSEYGDFSQVIPPRGSTAHAGSYPSWQDWRSFMDENLVGHIHRASETLKLNGATQPTIAELFCDFGRFSAASIDVWKLAEAADIVGVSDFERPGFRNAKMMMLADSISKLSGRSFFVVEALGGPKYNTAYDPSIGFHTPTDEEIVAEAVQLSGNGAKGLMYWCYRPRLSDKEAGEFGLTTATGKVLPRAIAGGKMAAALSGKGISLLAAYRKSYVAILESTEIQHLAAGDSVLDLYNQAVDGAAKLCIDNHINADFINPEHILKGQLAEYKVLLMPFAYLLDEPVIQAIKQFVAQGAMVIADYPVGMKNTNGIAYMELPGGGLVDMFGLERLDIVYLDHESRIKPNEYDIHKGSFVEVLETTQALTEALFGDKPLVCSNKYGKGLARYMGFQFFNQTGVANRDRLRKMLAQTDILPHIMLDHIDQLDEPQITSSCLSFDGGEIITLVHHGYGDLEVRCSYSANTAPLNFLTGETIIADISQGRVEFNIKLGSWGYIIIEKR